MKEKIICIEDAANPKNSTLKRQTSDVLFPLSQKDKEIILFMKQLLFELDGVGLAAPQIDIGKNIAVIYIPTSAALLRDNAIKYPMHVIINSSYEPIKIDEKYSDFEGCYSVKTVCGKIPRYNTIKVKYQIETGEQFSKIETGFYARVLQHEIDHLNGILITDRLTIDCLQGSFEEMLKHRRAELTKKQNLLLDKLIAKRKKLAPQEV